MKIGEEITGQQVDVSDLKNDVMFTIGVKKNTKVTITVDENLCWKIEADKPIHYYG